MTECMCIRAETQPNCTGVAETPDFCMGIAKMPHVCTGVAETPPDYNTVAGTPTLVQKKRNGLITTSVKKTLEVVD